MIANGPLAAGTRLSDNAANGRSNSFQPIVSPVLMLAKRDARCSHCFGTLSDDSRFVLDGPPPDMRPLLHRFCSSRCMALCKDTAQEEEITATQMVQQSGANSKSPACVWPAALLLYRLVRHMITQNEDSISELESHIDSPHTTQDEREFLKSTAAVAKCMAICSEFVQSASHNIASQVLDTNYLEAAVSKISTNSFTICDGEGASLGIGLYPSAAVVNHSCSPNLVQTFQYGSEGMPPSLLLTVCRSIANSGEELCIAYTDTTAPADIRIDALRKGYKFACTCHRCEDLASNDVAFGIRCPREGCKGRGRKQVEVGANLSTIICDSCGHADFASCIKRRDDSFAIVQRFQSEKEPKPTLDRMKAAYSAMKEYCTMDSWFAQEAGEVLVQAILDQVGRAGTETEQRELCSLALATLNELGTQKDERTSECCPLPPLVRRYKMAKLQLFLFHDPRPAMMMLQDVHAKLLVYFPRDHELILGLEGCMRGGMA